MAIEIEGVEFLTASDIQRKLGIARQTLWRWRRAKKIPLGRRYRGVQIVFTHGESDLIREYANRLEPMDAPRSHPQQKKRPKTRKAAV